jgi:hypothetical protein
MIPLQQVDWTVALPVPEPEPEPATLFPCPWAVMRGVFEDAFSGPSAWS